MSEATVDSAVITRELAQGKFTDEMLAIALRIRNDVPVRLKEVDERSY